MDYGVFGPAFVPSLRVVTTVPPAVEPVTVAEAKAWARVEFSDHDSLFADLIKAVREVVEAESRLAFITQTKIAYLGGFGEPWGRFDLPYPPLQAVTGLSYLNMGGTLTAIDPSFYRWAAGSIPGRIWLPIGSIWPIAGPYPDAVQATYTCGYGDTADSVPMAARLAMRSLVAANYNNPEGVQFLQGGQMLRTPMYESFINSLSYGFYG